MVSGFRSRFATPTPASAATPRHNLPNQPTAFVGRVGELADIAERLNNPACRLLTLIGPGGIGKTRLALQAAEAEISNYANGVFFVSLAPLRSADSLVPTIAEAIGFSFYRGDDPDDIGPNPRQQLLDYLQEKQMLLVMDNFEHLLEGVQVIDDILNAALGIKMLTTSRERLNLQGEWVVQVEGMPFPAETEPDVSGTGARGYSAVQLFLSNAQRIESSFALNEENESAVIRICRLVGGMPLGIELAAAWVQMLSPNEIINEIETNFDFLETTMRNVPERHRSVRAVFEYSWKLLQPPERDFMGKLSVFRGGFTREAASFIAANGQPVQSLPLLSSLVGKSLLKRGADGRYQLHELLRQFSAEKLASPSNHRLLKEDGKDTADSYVREAHSRYYLNRLVERKFDLNGRKQRAALDELETEIENVREGWRWAVTNCQTDAIAEAQQGLANFYWAENWLEEGAELFGQAANNLIQNGIRDRLLILRLQTNEAGYRLINGENEQAVKQFKAVLSEFEALDSPSDVANVLSWLGAAKGGEGKLDEAIDFQTRSLEIYRTLGDDNGVAAALAQLGFIANEQGHYQKAIEVQKEALALRRKTGFQTAIIGLLSNLGFVAYRQGEMEIAREYAEEALALNQLLENQAGISTAIRQLGMIAGLAGKYELAHEKYLETLTINRELGNPSAIANSYINLSHITYKMGNYADSERYARELLKIADKITNRWTMLYARNNLGMALVGLGRFEEAEEHLLKGLEIARLMRAVPVALETLTGFAIIKAETGEKSFAMELCSFIIHHPALIEDTKGMVRLVYERLVGELDSGVVETAENYAKERNTAWYWEALLDATIE
jgi:predicted ATPase/Tfp pilus assembly protein PilF